MRIGAESWSLFSALSGAGGASNFGVRLIQPGALAGGGLLTFSRAQAGGARSTALGADGTTWVEFDADQPRFRGAARRLLLEGQRTNLWTNPRMEPVSGAGLPTNYATAGTDPAITTYLAQETRDGTQGRRVQVVGTAGSNISRFLGTVALAVAAGNYTFSRFFSALGGWGSTPNVAPRLQTFSVSVTGANITPISTLARYALGLTVPGGGGSPALALAPNPVITSGTAVNLDSYFGWDMLELGAFASTPILPPVGTPGPSTRGQDNLTAAYAALFPNGVGTVLFSCMIPQSALSAPGQTVLDINDGTNGNRITYRNNIADAIVAGVIIGGTQTLMPTLGNMTPGTLFRGGITWDGSTLVANLDGGTNQSLTTGTPPGLTTLRVGNNAAGTAPMFGEFAYLDALPFVIPAANLPAAVAAVPG